MVKEQELREPPLLSKEKIARKLLGFNRMAGMYSKREWDALEEHVKAYWLRNADQILALIREADIKWMKEHCYLIAEGKLPENPAYCHPWTLGTANTYDDKPYRQAQQDMLKEVDGVAYRPCEEFK